jgi:hypothetical protein
MGGFRRGISQELGKTLVYRQTALFVAVATGESTMSVQKINVLVLPTHRLAPGTAWIADAVAMHVAAVAARFAGWRQRAVVKARDRGIARDRHQLQILATRYMATQPSFAKELLSASMNELDV